MNDRLSRTLLPVLLAGCLSLAPGHTWSQSASPASAPPIEQLSDADFPRVRNSDMGKVVIHAPQIESWEDFDRIVARSAIEVTPAGSTKSYVGTVHFTASTDTDPNTRLVTFYDQKIEGLHFEGTDADPDALGFIVRSAVQSRPKRMPLEVMLLYLPDDFGVETVEALKVEPPPIRFSSSPAVMVIVNGEPVLAPVGETDLKFVVNTNWDLFLHEADETWYLRHGARWLRSVKLTGAWGTADTLPEVFSSIPATEDWKEVRAAIPPRSSEAPLPRVYLSSEPAELILTEGPPKFEQIGATGLRYATNTSSDLFVYDDAYYFLVSGRWFRSSSLGDEWNAVTDLPKVFAEIPEEHPKDHVLASVPGTEEARLAAIEAQIPTKAAVRRDAGKDIIVYYAGDPEFVPIEGTTLYRAANTSSQVIRYGEQYYLCYNAVWFVSADAKGPWLVADTIPAEIYKIPPGDPAYNTTYVQVYDSTDDTVITGYTSGYEGIYVTTYTTVVYGTGWYYDPWYYYPPYGYPIYYGYPYSYGYGGWYNPATGAYGRTEAIYGPYGGARSTAVYNPRTGAYARGTVAWDSDEIAGSGYGYNPRTDTGFATNRYWDDDRELGWGESVVRRGDKWVRTESVWDDDTVTREFETSGGVTGGSTREWDEGRITGEGYAQKGDKSITTKSAITEDGAAVAFETSEGASGVITRGRDGETRAVGRSAEGDLYAGGDNGVYKRTEDGWYKRDGDDWQQLEPTGDRQGAQQRRNEMERGAQSENQFRARREERERSFARGSGSRSFSQADRLSRDHRARQRGFQSFNRNRMNRGMSRGRARRR